MPRRFMLHFALAYPFVLPGMLIMFREDGQLTARTWSSALILAASVTAIVAIAFGGSRREERG